MNFEQIRKLIKLVVQSRNSSFYRKKYNATRIDAHGVKNISDFTKLPFLTRDEIVQSHPFDRLYVSQEKIVSFNLSSGTTSQKSPLFVPMEKWDEIVLQQLYKKITKLSVQRVLVLANVAYSSARATNWLLDKKLNHFPFILGDINNLQLSAWIAQKMEIDGIETNPSTLFYFMPYLKELYPLEKIKYISMGGEYITKQRYAFFKQYFKKAFFDFRYGGAENQVLKGWRCEYLGKSEPRFFHPTTEYYYFEVIDPQSGMVLPLGEEGELVETSKQISAFPLIRYRTGDIVRLTSLKCPCGQSALLEVLGRARNDSLKLYGTTLHVDAIEKALATLGNVTSFQYQLHVYEVIADNRLKPRLVLDLYAKKTSKAYAKRMAKVIQDNLFISPSLTLSDLVKKEIFLPLEVRLLEKWPYTGKYLKIVPHLD